MTQQDDAAARLAQALDRSPYARFIGMRLELAGDEMTAILPFSDLLVGDTKLPAIHGGVLGAFMAMTALMQLSVDEPLSRQPRTIDVTVEYLRSGRPLTTFARAQIKRVGRRIANVHVEAWQTQRAAPIAALRGHFLISPTDL
jgi:acyl-coenzyme A thioesterase PaaI-like protein